LWDFLLTDIEGCWEGRRDLPLFSLALGLLVAKPEGGGYKGKQRGRNKIRSASVVLVMGRGRKGELSYFFRLR